MFINYVMMTNNNKCKVKNCRFHTSHTTRSHICGICNNLGHGQYECFDYEKKEQLKEHFNDIIDPEQRCKYNCDLKLFHKTDAHRCEFCFHYGHSTNDCPNKIISVKCPICRTNNTIKASQHKIIGIDIECCICLNNKIEIFFPDCGHICLCYDCFIQVSK